MQKNSSKKSAKKAVKHLLAAFIAISAGAAVYKSLPCCSGNDEIEKAHA